jgi:molybdenum cofactor synthesis domain-containing protein
VTTAGFVVIGDEILTGKIQDRNTQVLADLLFARGVRLMRVETISDDLDDIAETVRRMSERYDHVFTSGGIGPTHDDMTYEGVARAFGRGLAYRQDVLDHMAESYRARGRGELNEARKRMALMPEGCELLRTEGMWVPICVVENVHVLPGVPALFEKLVSEIADRFAGVRRKRILLYTQKYEGDIAEPLRIAHDGHPNVAIGSYPKYGEHVGYNVLVTLEGEDHEEVEALAEGLIPVLEAVREPPPAD